MTEHGTTTTAAADAPATGAASPEDARRHALTRLGEHARCGDMTLDEYTVRARAAAEASTAAEAENALAGIGELEPREEARHRRWLVGILGGAKHAGRWRLGSRLRIVAVFGGVEMDLGRAHVEAPESTITVVAVFGGVNVKAPSGLPIEFSGIGILGGKSDERGEGPPLPGAPVVLLRVFSLFGGVSVEERSSGRSIRDYVRGALNRG